MKPPPLGYSRPESVTGALAALARLGPDGKVLAGGQSLVPLLSMRLAAPAHLVDINRLAELAYVRTGNGEVRVGALARHAQVLQDGPALAAQPLLGQALRWVAHAAIRNRGTVVGSLVHADPAAELPAVLALLDGSVRLATAGGERVVSATDFFLGPLESAAAPGELAIEAVFPALAPATGTAFAEVSRRHGDYAVCGVAALAGLGPDGRLQRALVACLSVGPRPLVLDVTGAAAGAGGDAPDVAAAADLVRGQVDPEPDLHATAAYRRHLAGVLTARALTAACRHARQRMTEAGETRPPARPRPPQAPGTVPWLRHGAPPPGSAGPGGRPPGAPRIDPPAAPSGAPPPRPSGVLAGVPSARRTAREAEHKLHRVRMTVNGVLREVQVPARRLLSDCLRHDLCLTGTHVGCEHGVCGACTVLLDGAPARSCLTLAVTADGASVTTVEGLAGPDGTLSPEQQAFAECHGLQCGFCTPGFLVTVTAGLGESPAPSEAEARGLIGGNLCRCTGYQNIVAAVLRAAELRQGRRAPGAAEAGRA